MTNLQRLYLHSNELTGTIPSWLVNLTGLLELSLWSNQLTGMIPPEVAPALDRAALRVLYIETGGANWTDSTNWLSNEPLSEWYGLSTDGQGRVDELRLSANGLTGTIGAELGVLTGLAGLYLNDNELTGPIPPELENLANLQVFDVRNTGLSCVTPGSALHTWLATITFRGAVCATNRPSEIRAYWTDDPDNPQGSNEQDACAGTEPFRAYWNPPKSNGSFKSADEWEAEITPDPKYGASNVSFTIQNTENTIGDPRKHPELTGTVQTDGFSTLSIRVRGRFGNAWGLWSPRTGLYCWSSSSEERALVTMLAAEGARSVTEGTEVKFTLKRELPTTKEVMVKVSVTERGEVIQTGSYQPPEEVTFTPGDTTATLRVLTEDDDQQESDGAVVATLQPGPDYRLGQSSTRTAQVTVEDDEGGTPPGPGGPPGPVDTTRPPSAPRNLTAVAGNGEVVLTWDAPESDGGTAITDYEYRINQTGEWISIGSTDTTHTVTGLVNGTTYVFEVRAVNRIGKGSSSSRAEAAPEVVTLDFAHFANGEGIISDLVFVNVGTHPIRPALSFYDKEGNLIAAESVVDVTGDLEIQEDGSLSIQTAMEPLGELTISTHGQGELVSGSVKVVAFGAIGGVLRFDLPDVGVAGVGASPPVRDAVFPVRRQEAGINTGVAVHNLESSPEIVRCELMQAGVLRDAVSIPLAANGQTSWFIDTAFTAADTTDFAGSVHCDAEGPGMFTAVALELDAASRIFTTLPVLPVRLAGGRAAELNFAHFANGDGITSDLVFVNLSTERSRPAPTPFHSDILPLRPALYFYDTEGEPIAAESVVDITGDLEVMEDGGLTVLTEMEPLGVLTISTHGRGELVSGSVRVVADEPIGGVLRFDLPGIGVAGVWEPANPSATPFFRCAARRRESTPGWRSTTWAKKRWR